jgi:hypothetical protein
MRRSLLHLCVLAGAEALLLGTLGGCLTAPATECTRPGQVIWSPGGDPKRDAPRWVTSDQAAFEEAGVSARDVPKKYLVYVGVSEDKPDERAALFSAVDDMLKRYGAYAKKELDRILPEAAAKAKLKLPAIDTAMGVFTALDYLPNEQVAAAAVKSRWQAVGRVCAGEGPVSEDSPTVYRVFLLGLFDQDARRAYLYEAAKETFKRAIIRGEDRESILAEARKLIDKLY